MVNICRKKNKKTANREIALRKKIQKKTEGGVRSLLHEARRFYFEHLIPHKITSLGL